MTKIKESLLIASLFSLGFVSCKSQREIIQETPSSYVYLDQDLPFLFKAAHPYGDDVFVEYGDKSEDRRGNYYASLYYEFRKYGFNALDEADFLVDLYDTQELEQYIKEYEKGFAVQLGKGEKCFTEIPSASKGKKHIQVTLYDQKSKSFKSRPAELYILNDWNVRLNAEYDDPSIPPKEIYWIVISNAPGLEKGKSARMRLVFPPIYDDDDPEEKKIKEEVTQMICETARSFTWVDFNQTFKPDLWKDTPWFNEPHPEVSVSDKRKEP